MNSKKTKKGKALIRGGSIKGSIPDTGRPRLILLNKPFQVMSQFSTQDGRACLKDLVDVRSVYPVGRLDYDSEGLLLLTNQGWLQGAISSPKSHLQKSYLVQVEGVPDDIALGKLRMGLILNDGPTRPAGADLIEPPSLWDRVPPIRVRKSVPDSWLRISISEGRNRQVRRMTAAVGFPTLRLIRESVGPWALGDLQPGMWKDVTCPSNPAELQSVLSRWRSSL